MTMPAFTTFFPSAARWISTRFRQEYRLIIDEATAIPKGIVNQNANGAQGIWGLTPISAAQVADPPAAMLQDLAATFQLDESPYSRYRSDGTQLLPLDGTAGEVVPPGVNVVWFSPISITEANSPLIIQGGVRVIE